jgi:adenosylhomocysteine nucleosidase
MDRYDFSKQPSLLIQGAMDTETDFLAAQLEEPEEIILGNWKFVTGFLGEYREPVIISRTYQGMVNAAAATSLALVYFAPAAVINQGIGGGHDTSFHRGEIVLGEKVVPMGAMIRPFSGAGMGISESDFEPLPIEIFCRKKQITEKVLEFPCDKRMLALAESVKTGQNARRGVIGSADEWNNQLDRIALLRRRYHTAVEDMESAAPAELCLSYGIPFIGIRILSNSIVNGEDFDESVGVNGQKFVLKYVETLHEFLQGN